VVDCEAIELREQNAKQFYGFSGARFAETAVKSARSEKRIVFGFRNDRIWGGGQHPPSDTGMLHEREFVSLEPGSKTQSLSDRFVADSPLEGDGFEPPVRLGEANGPRALRLVR
jgi:hypothetical protein